MTYSDYLRKTSFNHEELLALSYGTLVSDPPPEFGCTPLPPLLMVDRVQTIEREGTRGRIIAEQDVRLDAWYFFSHFRHDPVQPGCLGVDAIWQLLGIFCSVQGATGAGRALGCKEVEFFGQIRPRDGVVLYDVMVRRYSELQSSGAVVAIADGKVYVDGRHIYSVAQAKVGFFRNLQYSDYPHRSRNSVGGVLARESSVGVG